LNKHIRFKGQSLFAMIAVVSIVIMGEVAWQPPAGADPSLPPMTLTVVALNGTEVVLHENDIGNLGPYSAYGGTRNSAGKLSNFDNYTGVPISTLLDLVGGIVSGYNVTIIAGDNYTETMSYEALNGTGLNTYDSTGALVQHNQTLTPMLSYYCNSSLLSSGGPLRLAIVGSEGLYTDGSLWEKNVTRLELHPNLQPMNLTLVALDGTQITINETTIASLPAFRGVGATRNSVGVVRNLGNYTGPTINTFLNLIGGMSNTTALRVTAGDNYTKTLSYDMVNGAFQAYDPGTGQPVQHNQTLTPILAYHFNDANLSLTDGPLRLAIIGPEGLATFSQYWVKTVVKLEIRYIDDVAVTNVTLSKTVVGQDYTCDLTAMVANLGGYDETFNVTLYANQTAFGVQMVMLPVGNSTTLAFIWNTTGYAYGNYTIKAVADTLPDETSVSDNTLTDGTVYVGIVGDINADHKVDMKDISMVAKAFGAKPGDARWNPNADMTGPTRGVPDGKVDMRDISAAAKNFGKHE
jgi:hypothetical protein